MKEQNREKLFVGLGMIILFAAWTVAVCLIDVKPIGPLGSTVGFATLNSLVHRITDVNMGLYYLTDWLGIVPIAVAICFALLGFIQLIKRKRLFDVDRSILILGVFYIAVALFYLLFEIVVINYRPVLIDGHLEASYPSSTTLLVMTFMPTAAIELRCRIRSGLLKKTVTALIALFVAFTVLCRLISGVHWFTDIIGGAILSTGLVALHCFLIGLNSAK